MSVLVRDILAKKTQEVASIGQEATVLEAATLMNQRHIGALVVTRGPKVVGIFTERDILRRIVAAQRDAAQTRVGEVMSAPVACCRSDSKLTECRTFMTTQRHRHFPVVDGNCLVGMISIGDILAHEAAAQQETIQYLNEYLYGPSR